MNIISRIRNDRDDNDISSLRGAINDIDISDVRESINLPLHLHNRYQ